jgi:diphthamide biosynthesis protein 2
MSTGLSAPPVLSTPDTHIFTETEPVIIPNLSQHLSDDQIVIRYEIGRTINEIKQNKWNKIALQFPDSMLPDSARVYQLLTRGLKATSTSGRSESSQQPALEQQVDSVDIAKEKEISIKLTILGDTSYGSCCVDEIAAEHVDAEAVIHYGRSCLSPTARLPVLYVFTQMELDHAAVCETFKSTFTSKDDKILITADSPFAAHVQEVHARLKEDGYANVFAADVIHDPSSLVPNRSVPDSLKQDPSRLSEWQLFHISDPPTSLLLTLSSRMKSIHIHPTSNAQTHEANSSIILRRRYALITSLSTVSTWGVLINTLSVKNYLHIVDYVKKSIADADKKSYLFVVGKLNAAKVANFAEIGAWVVIGCWESSLVDSRDFYRPIITPFELELALQSDEERVWTGEWRGDFQGVLDKEVEREAEPRVPGAFIDDEYETEDYESAGHDYDSEGESAPPDFDLRTGRYVSHSRPMRTGRSIKDNETKPTSDDPSTALTKRSNGDLLSVRGVASPGAEFLAQKRTWRGLGSDFEIKYDDDDEQGGLIEEGRTGVARGYTVAESQRT